MHVPTLPSKPSWETPISASREIVGAISDVADSAVDAATHAVRSARRRRSRRAAAMSLVASSWRWIAVGAVAALAVVVVRRRRGAGGAAGVDHAGVGRTERARTDGSVHEYDDDLLADAARVRATAAD